MPFKIIDYLKRKWRRWRWKMYFRATPLELRYSVKVLSQVSEHPFLKLLGLFLRYPRHFPCQLPPTPQHIMAYAPEAYMDEKHPELWQLRLLPIFRWRDTMQSSFYRLYEAFCAHDEPLIGYETEYFWKKQPKWNPTLLRDPREDGCTNAEQLAVLASLAEALIESFNWRLSWGLRRDRPPVEDENRGLFDEFSVPAWTEDVPRLEERLLLHKHRDPNDSRSDPDFQKRNVQAITGSLTTV